MGNSAATPSIFEWAGWIASIIIAISGFFITTYGWRVRGQQALALAKLKETHSSIDSAVESINDFIEKAISFWTEKDTETRPDQLIIGHQKIIYLTKQVCSLKNTEWPKEQISELRKLSTLNMETIERPIPFEDIRIKKLIRVSTKLIESNILKKTWDINIKQ